ncbi:uncharacterized protein Dana_GF27630 [Drosophila ananassae]|uniref:Uncharacterized protein n=1 Tax=Drosophila ananassae TaxID=7217 RepID=A0A0P8XLQ7_DROAN|nr:uncharacterized protein Dana_GF27630 [Drosophila ananassae]
MEIRQQLFGSQPSHSDGSSRRFQGRSQRISSSQASNANSRSTPRTNVRQQRNQHQRQQRHQWQHQHQHHQRQYRRQPGRHQPPQRTGSLNYWQPLQTYDRNSNGQANSRSSQNPSQQQQEQPQNRIVRNPFRRSQPNNSNAYGSASRAKNPAEAHLTRFQAKLRAERTGNLAYVRQQRSSTQVTPNANRGQSQSLSQQKGNYVEVQNSQVNQIQQNYAQLLKLHIRTQARLDKLENLFNKLFNKLLTSAGIASAREASPDVPLGNRVKRTRSHAKDHSDSMIAAGFFSGSINDSITEALFADGPLYV